MNCTNCTNCAKPGEGRDCPLSPQASRDALSLFASPWFWAGGAASLLVWSFVWLLCQ